ncbi:hypothetical protein N7481_011297 [Penicillium waksmanii]|uniref:uncharacterized protein n=1 Tax=Penicillium waksmanii TaxID=69791 RepID=UPI0025484B48|nr:uncharacterized protein N7481_011297 [Penicillium waksmanii]KAJ5974087.1 hypothetical protein N7481_011297 [Penicillium waksmanii]
MFQDITSQHIVPQDCFAREPQFWLHYGTGPSTIVSGWPSQGGMYTLQVSSRVEIDFLELDPFNSTLRPTDSDPEWQQKENKHCDLMRQLGPTWWQNENVWMLNQMSAIPDERVNEYIRVGWTSDGGVWVWKTTRSDADEIGGAQLLNARTMQERCMMIEKLGGTFYADPKDCPFLDLR